MIDRLNQFLRSEGISPWNWLWVPSFLVVATLVTYALFWPLTWDVYCLIHAAFLVIMVILIILFVLVFRGEPTRASKPCGLVKGNLYRVIHAFSSGETRFREGETLVFNRGGNVDDDEQFGLGYDFYKFQSVFSQHIKRIQSTELPDVDEWVRCLQHVIEPVNQLFACGPRGRGTVVLGQVVSSDGTAIARAKVTISHKGRILFGGRTAEDGCFYVRAWHHDSFESVAIRVVRPGYRPFSAEVEANSTYRASRIVLVPDQ